MTKAIIRVGLVVLVAAGAFGQRAGGPGHGQATPGIPPISPIPPIGPVTPLGATFPGAPFRGGFGSGRNARPAPLPYFFGGYDYGYSYDYAPSPNVVVVQQPPPYIVVPPAPPEIVQSEIREYQQTGSAQPAPADEQQSAFAIALKDGTVRSAVAVSVQGDVLHYVDAEGQHYQIRLDTVDRETTRRLNLERKLQLQLPPPGAK